jgi:hypothetical protein
MVADLRHFVFSLLRLKTENVKTRQDSKVRLCRLYMFSDFRGYNRRRAKIWHINMSYIRNPYLSYFRFLCSKYKNAKTQKDVFLHCYIFALLQFRIVTFSHSYIFALLHFRFIALLRFRFVTFSHFRDPVVHAHGDINLKIPKCYIWWHFLYH